MSKQREKSCRGLVIGSFAFLLVAGIIATYLFEVFIPKSKYYISNGIANSLVAGNGLDRFRVVLPDRRVANPSQVSALQRLVIDPELSGLACESGVAYDGSGTDSPKIYGPSVVCRKDGKIAKIVGGKLFDTEGTPIIELMELLHSLWEGNHGTGISVTGQNFLDDYNGIERDKAGLEQCGIKQGFIFENRRPLLSWEEMAQAELENYNEAEQIKK